MDNPIFNDYEQAKSRRNAWEALWKDCYDYALPQREMDGTIGSNRTDHIYDGTAMDAVEQLAASLLGNLTPPWSQWFGFTPGPQMDEDQADALAPALEKAGRLLQSHLDKSNFTTEMHQAFLDLIVGGTATLLFEEAQPGDYSAFRFKAIPLNQIALDEGARTGRLDTSYREVMMTLTEIQNRFGENILLPPKMIADGTKDANAPFPILPESGRLSPFRGQKIAQIARALPQRKPPFLERSFVSAVLHLDANRADQAVSRLCRASGRAGASGPWRLGHRADRLGHGGL